MRKRKSSFQKPQESKCCAGSAACAERTEVSYECAVKDVTILTGYGWAVLRFARYWITPTFPRVGGLDDGGQDAHPLGATVPRVGGRDDNARRGGFETRPYSVSLA